MNPHVYAPQALKFTFVHASGPGGQHVNKTSTAVELKVVLSALDIPAELARRLRTQQKNRINKDGELVIQADQYRSQLSNRKDAISRFEQMLAQASIRPKQRIATRPSKAAKTKRMNSKTQRGKTKINRQKPTVD